MLRCTGLSTLRPAAFSLLFMPPFKIYGTTHWAALGVTAILWLAMWLLVHWKRPWHRSMEITLAVILLSQWIVRLVLSWRLGYYNPATALPLHLCDVVSILGGAHSCPHLPST